MVVEFVVHVFYDPLDKRSKTHNLTIVILDWTYGMGRVV